MKYVPLILGLACLTSSLFGQQETGGLEKVRLHVSSYIVRDPASSSVPAFDFQNGADTWTGTEINNATETTDVVDWDAVNICAQNAFAQSSASCYELVSDYYFDCGGDFFSDCWNEYFYWAPIPGCTDALQEQIVQELEAGTHPCVTENTAAFQLARNNHYLLAEPGVSYSLDISSLADVSLRTSFLVPEGYVVFIENTNGEFEPLSKVEVDFVTTSSSITFQLRELRAEAPPLFGQASDFYVGDVKWELGLGVLGNGDPAGRLVLHEKDLTASIYTREALKYYRPVTAGSGELEVVEDVDGFLRQIRTPSSFVDLVDTATDNGDVIQYEVRFYAPLPDSATKTGGLYAPSASDLLVTYRLGREAAQGLDAFFVKQFDSSSNLLRTDDLSKTADGSTTAGVTLNDWTMTTTATSGSHNVSKTLSVNNDEFLSGGSPTGLRLQTVTYDQVKRIYDEEATEFTTESLFTFAPDIGLGSIGELLFIQYRGDDASGSLNGRQYEYRYSLSTLAPQSYGRRVLSIDAFGAFTYVIYDASEASRLFGEEFLVIRPGEEAFDPYKFTRLIDHDNDPETDPIGEWEPPITSPNNFARFNLISKAFDYDGVSVRDASVITAINDSGVTSLNPIFETVQHPTFGDYKGEKIEVVCAYKPYDFPKASNRRNATFKAKFTPNTPNRRLIGKPLFVFRPDRTKTSYGYFEGAYRGLSDAFVTLEVSGYHTADLAHSDTADGLSINDQVHGSTTFGHEGLSFDIDEITLSPGQSTKKVTVRDAKGRVRYVEQWAYTSGSQWEKIEDVEQTFTKFGQLTQKTLNGRIVYEAQWDGIRKEWEKDEAGVKTTFEYDGIGRVTALVVEGASGVDGIPETKQTNFFYDARDRVVVTETVVSSSEKLVEKEIYDAEGYLLSKTEANGLTTTFDYEYDTSNFPDFLGLKKTTNYPDGTYRETFVKQNGEFWKDVLYNSGAQVIEENRYSFANNVTAPTGSDLESTNRKVRIDYSGEGGAGAADPYVEKYYDASGKVRFEQSPTSVAASPFQKRYDYDGATGQLTSELETEVATGATSGALGLRRIKQYGDMGEVTLRGIDMNDDQSLTAASNDRIKEKTERYVLNGGNVWLEETTFVYPEHDADNPFERTRRTQLNGHATDTVSVIVEEDLAGNETTTTVTVDRTSHTLTTTVDYPDSDTNSIAVVQNGLKKSSTSKEGLTRTFAYDQAGRRIRSTDARGNSTVTIYESGKDRVEYRIHGITETVTGTEGAATLSGMGYATQNGYDPVTGRLVWEKNPDGNHTRFAYNDRGLLEKRWGEATYPVWNEYDSFGQLEKRHTFGMANTADTVDFTGEDWPTAAGDGDVTTYDYFDASGLLKSRTDALGRQTDFTYDARGRLVTKITPDGGAGDPAITVTQTYFPKTDELKAVDYTGDNDLTPDLDFTYHRSGDVATVQEDGVERSFHFDFDSSGNSESDLKLLAEHLPSYYTDISALDSSDTGHGHERIRYGYQNSGAMPGRIESFGIGTAAAGDDVALASILLATGYDYDSKGRLNTVDVAPTRSWTYTYFTDTNQIGGRALSGSGLESIRDYEPDRDLLRSIESLHGTTSLADFEYSYNALGNREDVVQSGALFEPYDGGLVVDYGYNDRMEITRFDTVRGGDASVLEGNPMLVEGRSFAFDYDSLGNRSAVTHKRVRLEDAPADQAFNWSANDLNQLTSRENPDFVHVQGSSVLDSFVTVGFEPDNLKRAVRHGEFFTGAFELRDGTTDAVYVDDLDLYSVIPDGWIDTDGTTVLGDLIDHQQRAAWLPPTSENFEYDVRGNLTSDSRWDYTWDGANRLRFIETSATAVTAGVAREKFGYRYDYKGRRVAKDVYAWTGSAYESDPLETTLYYYDGWNLVYEATYTGVTFAAGVPTAATFESEIAYHWGLDWSTSLQGAGGVGGLVSITFRDASGSPETRYPGFDGNGNLVLLADESGTVTAAYEYGPYGELWRASGPDAGRNPFRFSTKYRDAETALYYYGHRYYSPDYGRFISQDPIRESGGLNLYAFVNNNPTNYYDYLGMFFDFGGAFDSASNFVGGFIPDYSFSYETTTNFESGLTTGGWALQIPTFDFGMAYFDYGGMSDFTARTTSSSGSNWSYNYRALDSGSFKYDFSYSYNPSSFGYSFGDYGSDAYSFSFGDTYIREIAMPEYNLWAAAGEGLGQGAYEVAMSFRRTAEGIGTTAGYLWYEPTDTILGMHDQITTNLADGYFLLKDTTWSDVGRDIASFGELYANDPEFRGGITDMFSDSAIGLATGSGFAKFKPAADEYVTVYRGVHSQHPDLPNAYAGKANPRGGHSDPLLHNRGYNDSIFTSWTTDYGTALDFALGKYSGFDDAGGVILQQRVLRSKLVNSPDAMGEFEVLRVGPITGAQSTIISR